MPQRFDREYLMRVHPSRSSAGYFNIFRIARARLHADIPALANAAE